MSTPAIRDLQHQLENQANSLSKIQKDIAKNHQVRKQYTIQHGENEMVQKELELLSEDANVYKLIGPVLVKQDLAEAKANVSKRIEYITAELRRLDGMLKGLEEQQNAKKEEVESERLDSRGRQRKTIEVRRRLDGMLKGLEEQQNAKKEEILKIQQRLQALQAGKAKA